MDPICRKYIKILSRDVNILVEMKSRPILTSVTIFSYTSLPARQSQICVSVRVLHWASRLGRAVRHFGGRRKEHVTILTLFDHSAAFDARLTSYAICRLLLNRSYIRDRRYRASLVRVTYLRSKTIRSSRFQRVFCINLLYGSPQDQECLWTNTLYCVRTGSDEYHWASRSVTASLRRRYTQSTAAVHPVK